LLRKIYSDHGMLLFFKDHGNVSLKRITLILKSVYSILCKLS